jgi:hypothetical protein
MFTPDKRLIHLGLGPWGNAIQEDFSQTPNPVRQPRCHRRRPRLPALEDTRARHRLQLWQGQAQAGMGQNKIVVCVEQSQLLTQSRFVFAQRVDPTTDRRHMLAKIQMQAVAVGRRVTPPAAVPDRSMPVSRHSAPQYLDACHAYLAGDSLDAPAFSHCGSVHGALAGVQSANLGDCH